ncbi:hypothetical protein ACSQ67_023001 [Phaseolus vulgaris]
MIMDSLSNSSIPEQVRENNVNKNFLLPRKPVSYSAHLAFSQLNLTQFFNSFYEPFFPLKLYSLFSCFNWPFYVANLEITTKARQPNQIIYRKLRRGSAGRIPEKQIEKYPTNKELLRTIAYLRTAIYENDEMLPNNKAYIIDEEDEEEWSTQSEEEKGQKKLYKLIQKLNSNDSTYTPTKNQRKTGNNIPKNYPPIHQIQPLDLNSALRNLHNSIKKASNFCVKTVPAPPTNSAPSICLQSSLVLDLAHHT